ncbi:MAG: hypothetical protein FJ279_03240 [Planctomycetes bacterium]|nr:hypothetical protein [Planctomycetota bacterium]
MRRIRAYDLIYKSGQLEKLSAALRKDVKRDVEDFFRATVNWERTFPRYLSNMEPTVILGLSVAAQVIAQPEFVHDALIRAKLILAQHLFADGLWRQGALSYHQQTLSGVRNALTTLKGYSDPPGYIGREDQAHLENLNPQTHMPLLSAGHAAIQNLVFPNGQYAAIHDTWTAKTLGPKTLGTKPLAESRPELLWAYGHAVLGRGKSEHQIQAHLHFSGAHGHAHADSLNLIVFAKGREMLADIGYTHTVLRPYALWTAAHNVVVIDERDQAMSARGGSLIAFDAANGKIQYVEAEARSAYPGLATTYQRALVLIALSDTDAYVLDVFRVAGGKHHDWFLHGNADDPQGLSSNLKLTQVPDTLLGLGAQFTEWATEQGRNVVADRNNSYGLIRDLRATKTDETWSATFAYTDTPQKQLRVTMLGQAGTEVLLGRSPAIRPAKENNADIYRHWRPVIVARRRGEGLSSVFTVIHEPFEGQPFIRSVQRLPADGDALGLRVESAAGVDYHLLTPSANARCQAKAEQPLALAGRYGFIRVVAGNVVAAYLLDGTELTLGGYKLSAERCPEGLVAATRAKSRGAAEDALVVSPAITAPEAQLSQRVVAEFGDGSTYGLLMTGLRTEGGKTVIHLAHDPGFEVAPDYAKAKLTFYPHRDIAGEVKFRIPNSIYRE